MIKCPLCTMKFTTKYNLETHVGKKHKNEGLK
jgi:uncharacterized C2H2 Zn-finger protein